MYEKGECVRLMNTLSLDNSKNLLFDEAMIQRRFGNLKEIQDHYPKYVVTMDEFPIQNSYYAIKQMHLRDFLLKELAV